MTEPVPVATEPKTYLTLAVEVTKRYPEEVRVLSKLYRRYMANLPAIEAQHAIVCPLITEVAAELKLTAEQWRMDETLNACVNSHRSIYP